MNQSAISPSLTFGEKVECERERLDLSATAFAKKIGIDRQLYGQWKTKDRCTITAANLQKLCDATDTTQDYWRDKSTLGDTLVDEMADFPSSSPGHNDDGEVAMDEDPMAQAALSLLMNMPLKTAMHVIEEAATRLSAKKAKSQLVPIQGV